MFVKTVIWFVTPQGRAAVDCRRCDVVIFILLVKSTSETVFAQQNLISNDLTNLVHAESSSEFRQQLAETRVWTEQSLTTNEQVALLSQRGCAMRRVCQQLASTVQNVEQSLLLLIKYATHYHCVHLNALFCCLWHNVDASCHKHFVVFSRNQHRRLLPAMCHNLRDSTGDPVDNTWHLGALTAGTKARYRLRIAISTYPTCIQHPHQGGSRRSIAMPFGMEKL